MSTMHPDVRRVRIATCPERDAVIEIDGRDVASAVEAYRITQTVNEGPEATLYVKQGWRGMEFEGLAEVFVEPADVRHVVIGFLDAVDWRKLDEAVLVRGDLDGKPGELTRGLLSQLREWAAGA
ncbi:hypothetical protein O1L44_32060 [Streptomyces noursei]|uniref:hypothetical protein n=1 Tax=Streptomyces noursei TaxID=1971 RepID=UPI00081D26A3|nr:hypothetical protein SNOUR_34795 [Streptomyces noursei ATCC 11455]MCZ0996703.1 hypothetical protein [Streptomyces noursei]